MNKPGKGGFGDHPEHINKSGANKGSISFVAIAKKKLEKIPEGERRTVAELLVEMWIEKARDDGTAFRDLWDRIDGRSKQVIEVNNSKDAEWLEAFKNFTGKVSDDTDPEPDRPILEPAEQREHIAHHDTGGLDDSDF